MFSRLMTGVSTCVARRRRRRVSIHSDDTGVPGARRFWDKYRRVGLRLCVASGSVEALGSGGVCTESIGGCEALSSAVIFTIQETFSMRRLCTCKPPLRSPSGMK